MNRNSILDYLPLVNHQIIVHEALFEYHRKADAMLNILLKANISKDAISTIHDYLWALSDNIASAKCLNGVLLHDLMKITGVVKPKKPGPKGGSYHAYC